MSNNSESSFEKFLTGKSASSYYGRIKSKDTMDTLARKVAYSHAYRPTNAKGFSQFMRLKQADSNNKVTVSTSYNASVSGDSSNWTSKLMDAESAELLKEIESQAAKQFVQNFYNSYMSPANSDIVYRLGAVTKTKHSSGFYDSTGKLAVTSDVMYDSNGNIIANSYNSCEALGQTDRFGRIDTVSNFRVQIDVEASSIMLPGNRPLTPGYSEYYVNWYFPPYNASAFDVAGINRANLAAVKREAAKQYKVSAAAATSEFEKAIEAMVDTANKTKTSSLAEDKSNIPTFDPVDLMCARDGFTYRTAGYKAINDNITFLQHIFEECSGVVSTYLTDWDLSLYIQEGLLTEGSSGNVWLCNRIEDDNPQGLTGNDAYTWGALNAAVSKLPVGGLASNERIWNPQSFYLSSYWWPYSVSDRGDGLSTFWDNATSAYDSDKNTNLRKTFLGKIKYDDYLHAAYAGWKSFDDIKYYQLLYTTPDDGLSMVDIVHVQESNGTAESPYTSMYDEIRAIQDALYMDDPSLGFGDTTTVKYEPGPQQADTFETARVINGASYNRRVIHYVYTDPYDSTTKKVDYTDYYLSDKFVTSIDSSNKASSGSTNSVNVGGEGNISILGAEIPGSSMLKVFLKKDQHTKAALGIANKTKKGFGSLGGNNSSDDGSGDSSPSAMSDMFSTSNDENGRYSNPLGIPRLSPALFGGPHGAYASPQTMQAYFDTDNPFLSAVARINPNIKTISKNFTSTNKKDYYSGVEASYMYPAGRGNNQCYIGRSPSETLHLLTSGVCDVQNNYKCTYLEDSNEVPCSGAEWDNVKQKKRDKKLQIVVTIKGYTWPTKDPMGNEITYETKVIKTTDANGNPVKKTVEIEYDGSGTTDWIEIPDTVFGEKENQIKKNKANALALVDGKDCPFYTGDGSPIAAGKIDNSRIFVKLKIRLKRGNWKAEVTGTYKRPLLHCIPMYAPEESNHSQTRAAKYSEWQIAKYCKAPDPNLSINGKTYSDYLAGWGSPTRDEAKLASEYESIRKVIEGIPNSETTYYRLTMPYNGDSFKDNPASVKCGWYAYAAPENPEHGPGKNDKYTGHLDEFTTWTNRYKPEEEFVAHMLKNAGEPGSDEWTNVFYCYSDPNDTEATRRSTGPRALVRIPTRLQKSDATYNEFHGGATGKGCKKKHKPKCKPCHWDHQHWVGEDITTTYTFIECDVDKATDLWVSANFNTIYRPDITEKNVMATIPSTSSIVSVPNSVWQLLRAKEAPKKFRFAGKGMFDHKDSDGNEGNNYLHGWGMYNALPGFKELADQGIVENANECLCFGTQYKNAKSKPLREFDFKLPIFESNQGTVSFKNGQYSFIANSKNPKLRYTAGKMSTYDPGMENFLKKMYTSCTLFVHDGEIAKNNLKPIVTDISNCVIAALKIVEHQKAYLKFAKEFFMNSVEGSEVIRIIDKCVDKKIVYASVTAKNTNSIYYNPWIEKAYELYSDEDINSNIETAFNSRITAIDTFIGCVEEFMKTTNSNNITEVSAVNWSYNDYLSCYDLFSSFETLCSGLDSSIEEYFYSYLNVLYEYRRFYINKRCNKQEGTLWICRAFESAVPILNGSANEDKLDLAAMVENESVKVDSYPLVMKRLTNNLFDKGKAIITENALSKDRIAAVYMPCTPATEAEWNAFISGKTDEEILKVYKPDPNKANTTYPVYIKRPKDGTYQLISAEYLKNKQNKDYNAIMEDLVNARSMATETYLAKKRYVNDEIEDCIFPIVWSKDLTDSKLQDYIKSAKELKEAAAAQAEAKKSHIAAQQEQVRVTEAETKKYQEKLKIEETWQSSVDTSKQCITDYYDYAEPYFYSEVSGQSSRFGKLKKAVDLFDVLDYKGSSKYNELLANFKEAYNLSDNEVNSLVANTTNDASINFDDDKGFSYGYCVGVYTSVPTSFDKAKDTQLYKATFFENIDEFYNKVYRYIDSSINLPLYEVKLAEAKTVSESAKEAADANIAAEKIKVSNALVVYNQSVETYNNAVANQNEKYTAYNNSKKNEASKNNRLTNYTWLSSEYPPNDPMYPTIIFNLIDGIDLSKVDPSAKSDPQSTICSAGNFVDYWYITIPIPPVNIGYDTRLKLKTYESDATETSQFSANMATTVAGPFAYSLYPITEDQQNAIAAVSADLTSAEQLIKNTYS